MKSELKDRMHLTAAIVTWFIVFGLGVLLLREPGSPYANNLVEFVFWQVGFIVSLLFTVRDPTVYGRRWQGFAFLFVTLSYAMILGWRFSIDFLPIYTIMWVTLLPYFFSTRSSMVLLILVNLAWYIIARFSWGEVNAQWGVLLFATFHIFGLLSSLATRNAEHANSRAQELNRDLLATQQLLADAAKENERTRIARDLHDQLGHHMTALTINLQVASRLADGEVKTKVDHCHELSKQLLGDVRKAVSTLREHRSLDLEGTLRLLVERVPGLNVHLEIEPGLTVTSVSVAEAVVRCVQEGVTNTLRHANASENWIRIWCDNGTLCLSIRDNGRAKPRFSTGNGLAGMRERIEKLSGELVIASTPQFEINVRLPQATLS